MEGVLESVGVSQAHAEKILSMKRIELFNQYKDRKIQFEDILMLVDNDSKYKLIQGWKTLN